MTKVSGGEVDVRFDDQGEGRAFLLLHGGGGPQTVAGFAARLAAHGRVITPVHAGFGGTERPEWLSSMAGLAEVYVQLLEDEDLHDVVVVGNSMGGWTAAEMALLGSDRISGIVLVDAVGIEVEGHPVVDIFPLTLDELSKLSYHDPAKFGIDPSTFTDAQKAGMAANRAALAVYGASMADPTLRERLAGVKVPSLVLWGESDQVVDPEYGRAYAEAIPGSVFHVLPGTGHVPQIETPELLLDEVTGFAGHTGSGHAQ
ncbi:alpha/beta fold hydrolase [Umezawaea tangerina]|uniref:Pimeloyl-ACP methyl ester carboxylesterase n=1 Tax=Umezawaea tangerina TaxID=84725 RepID=A0A2T0SH06_9PSEU|nr:alpha/beta hydrolase [Umezawaea tangerina]PRY32700.1 pimeloyl-ACP methyl ester carboxylesterase [Umezawaea tangerina]